MYQSREIIWSCQIGKLMVIVKIYYLFTEKPSIITSVYTWIPDTRITIDILEYEILYWNVYLIL